jgi:CBS domain-containing protein
VIQDAQRHLLGVLSERDIVHALDDRGILATSMYVAQLMAVNGPQATMFDTVAAVIERMTNTRTRHLPILDRASDTVIGVVSTGDVMKSRFDEKAADVSTPKDIAGAHRVAA